MSSEIDPKTEIIGIINNAYLKEIRNIIEKGDHNTFITEYNKHKSIIEKYESNVKNIMIKNIKSIIRQLTVTTVLNALNENAQSGNLNLEAIYKIINDNEKVKTKLSIKFDEIYNSIRSDIKENEKRIINEKYELVELYETDGNGKVAYNEEILKSLENPRTTLYTNQEVVGKDDKTIVKPLDEMTELGQYKNADKEILKTTLNGKEKNTELYGLDFPPGNYPRVVGIDIYKARINNKQQGGKRKSRRKTKKKSKRTNRTKTPKKNKKPQKKTNRTKSRYYARKHTL